MKLFQQRELNEAYAFAQDGGQALHIISGRFADMRHDAPQCFKGQREIAHLFDHDTARLIATARSLGVRIIKVEREGTHRQHIDLCKGPLRKAKKECDQ